MNSENLSKPDTTEESPNLPDDEELKAESSESSSDSENTPKLKPEKKKKRRPKYRQKKLVMNIAQTKYHVVKYVGKKLF